MSAVDNTPENKNFLSPLKFGFLIKKTPHVNFFIQGVNLPPISMNAAMTPTPFVDIPNHGEHLKFENLTIKYKVDEDFQNYQELYNWLIALGKPENFQQYKDLQDNPIYTGDTIYSDLSILAYRSSHIPHFEITFTDAYPISVGDIKFNTDEDDVHFITSSATFKYTNFTMRQISS